MGRRDNVLVSVVIATNNRDGLLAESLTTVLNQTHRTLEVIVVDDGQSRSTQQIVESFADSRLRYVAARGTGASAARNQGADVAMGEWVAVHDDDDLMLPERIARQFAVAHDQADVVHGAFVNFEAETGELAVHPSRDVSIADSMMSGYAPGHGTWLVRTELLRHTRYDETLTAAIDNDLALRLLADGATFVDAGIICQLRRVHSGSITAGRSAAQKAAAAARLDGLRERFRGEIEPRHGKRRAYPDFRSQVASFLPDYLLELFGQQRAGDLCRLESELVDEPRAGSKSRPTEYSATLRTAAGMSWQELYSAAGEGFSTSTVRLVGAGAGHDDGRVTPADQATPADGADAAAWAVAGALLEMGERQASGGVHAVVFGSSDIEDAVREAGSAREHIRASAASTGERTAHKSDGQPVTVVSFPPGDQGLLAAAEFQRRMRRADGTADVVVLAPAAAGSAQQAAQPQPRDTKEPR